MISCKIQKKKKNLVKGTSKIRKILKNRILIGFIGKYYRRDGWVLGFCLWTLLGNGGGREI